jgi:hypothetical protein
VKGAGKAASDGIDQTTFSQPTWFTLARLGPQQPSAKLHENFPVYIKLDFNLIFGVCISSFEDRSSKKLTKYYSYRISSDLRIEESRQLPIF